MNYRRWIVGFIQLIHEICRENVLPFFCSSTQLLVMLFLVVKFLFLS